MRKNDFQLGKNDRLSMDSTLQEEYDYYTTLLDDWNVKQINGLKARIKTSPKFEFNEPDISFFSNLEKNQRKNT